MTPPQSQALELLREASGWLLTAARELSAIPLSETETGAARQRGVQILIAESNKIEEFLLSAQKDEAGAQGERRVLKDRRNPQDGDRNAPYRRMGPRRSTDKPAPVQPAAHKGEKG